jgi:hypothetical protein
MLDEFQFARGRAMLLYFVIDPDEAGNIVRFGFTLRQAAYIDGNCGTGAVIWLSDRPRRFDLQREACLEVEVPEGDEVVRQLAPQPAFKLPKMFEGCAAEINERCQIRRLSDDEAQALHAGHAR